MDFMSNAYPLIISYGERIILSLVFLIVGLKVINVLAHFTAGKLEKAKVDQSLQPFLVSIFKVALQVMLVISIASMLGAEMTSFIAVLGAATLAVGFALQGSLANFAGGVLILLLKPFKVGDYIEAAGFGGTVKEIQIFYSILDTPDNKRIIIPNANLSNSSTINYSVNPNRRIDFVLGVGYQDSMEKVRNILQRIASENPLMFEDPPPQIVLGEHGDNSLIVYFRVWCKMEDYWSLYWETLEKIKAEFDKEGINIPYPQLDVHMINQ